MGKISLGKVNESAGTNVVRINVGMYAKIIKIIIGESILFIFALQIRPLKYSIGAVGGVTLPIPRLTPRMAAK